ncbi:MAG: DUF1028 domain-containing protein [Anaerolineales bacterium]|nr:DUF1028 domain-containing protein [Anaerolineales bacterium]
MRRNGILHTTYSIVARDPWTGDFGAAVQTHQMCVGPHVLWLDAGVGAVATQSLTNLHFGPMGLSMLREGFPADRVIAALSASDKDADLRQMAVVDRNGVSSAWTGKRCIAFAGHQLGEGYSVQANLMQKDTVVAAMSQAYEAAQGDLAQRMLAALEAAQAEGGDLRGMQSAALKVVPGSVEISGMHAVDVIYDLRVDEHGEPLEELARLVRLSKAGNLSEEGTRQVAGGEITSGLKLWEQARRLAPELEELPFWQGLTLADDGGDAAGGAAILKLMLDKDPRREFWLDLIRRVEKSGLLERKGVAEELLAALPA